METSVTASGLHVPKRLVKARPFGEIGRPAGRMKFKVYDPYGILLYEAPWTENLVTNVGKQQILDLVNGVNTNKFLNLGIGNGTTASSSDTGLAGASTYYQPFDAGFPTRSGAVATYQVTVAQANANFTHTEFALCTGSPGILVTHLVPGTSFTKTSSVSIIYIYQFTQG